MAALDLEASKPLAGADMFLNAYDPCSMSCLVLDARMPEVSGFQLQEQLHARSVSLPVIFVSGHGDIPMSMRALQNGAFDFFEKLYNSQQMLERIQKTLKSAVASQQSRARRLKFPARLKMLSRREREVLDQMILGASSMVIARELNISVKTIDVHRASIK